ncbi:MAG: RIP metalloprotease RseP [Dokdonella sp.]|uniref:RIP metalloprotease RseP n=1 Tax=Dokdonella sp. TaxID=2291710 RepID=UPI003267A959
MSEFFGSVWWLLVTLGLLITFHEYGHFVVARYCRVKVLKFSIGFGPTLWSRFDRHGTQFVIAAIPLGGFVKMLDEREVEGVVGPEALKGAFNRKTVGQRMAITAAGPVFNLIFAVAALWLMFVIGRPDYVPVIDTPKGLAAEAGLHADDRIVAVGTQKIGSWSNAMQAVSEAAALHQDVGIEVAGANGSTRAVTLALSKLPPGAPDAAAFDRIGLGIQPPLPIVDNVEADTPAARGGMQAGDRVTAINDVPVRNFSDFATTLADQAAKNPQLQLAVDRNGARVPLTVTAERRTVDGKGKWVLGIMIRAKAKDAVERFGPLQAIPAAFGEIGNQTRQTVGMLWGMVTGHASLKNLSGVITIAQVANTSAQMGIAWFLTFLAAISLSLAILNLLPIPILDGGHLLYYLIEIIKGSPVSERMQIAGQYVGLTLLVAMMGLAFYNDILRIAS